MTTRITTGPFLASYAYVFTPRKNLNDDLKYSVTMIFPKKDTGSIAAIKTAIDEAIKEKWGAKPPKGLKLPLRDGDAERDEDYFKGTMFMNASSNRKPGVVDKDLTIILDGEDESGFYSGCTARATVTFFPFEAEGSKGVGVGLHNVQKLKGGPRLDGSIKAENDFTSMEEVDLDGLD